MTTKDGFSIGVFDVMEFPSWYMMEFPSLMEIPSCVGSLPKRTRMNVLCFNASFSITYS